MTESSKKRPSKSLNNSISSTPLKPSAKMVKVSEESDVSISKLFELVSDMNKKLDKLDCIEIHLSRVDKDIADLKESVSFVHGSTDEIKKEQSSQAKLLQDLNEKVMKIEAQAAVLQQNLVDLRARSMRCNLPFYNLPEREDEESISVIQDVLLNTMKLEGADQIEIERAHRMGKKTDAHKPRPIVAKFLRFQDKEFIRKSAHVLKGSRIGISEQFPKEIAEKRKALYPVMKKAKSDGQKTTLIKDKLFINGQRYYHQA